MEVYWLNGRCRLAVLHDFNAEVRDTKYDYNNSIMKVHWLNGRCRLAVLHDFDAEVREAKYDYN